MRDDSNFDAIALERAVFAHLRRGWMGLPIR